LAQSAARHSSRECSKLLELVHMHGLRADHQLELVLVHILHKVPGVVGARDFGVERLEESAAGPGCGVGRVFGGKCGGKAGGLHLKVDGTAMRTEKRKLWKKLVETSKEVQGSGEAKVFRKEWKSEL